jgi:hypothetical protein
MLSVRFYTVAVAGPSVASMRNSSIPFLEPTRYREVVLTSCHCNEREIEQHSITVRLAKTASVLHAGVL